MSTASRDASENDQIGRFGRDVKGRCRLVTERSRVAAENLDHRQLRVARPDPLAGSDGLALVRSQPMLHAGVVDSPRAVVRLSIDQRRHPIVHPDLCVKSRHRRIGKDHRLQRIVVRTVRVRPPSKHQPTPNRDAVASHLNGQIAGVIGGHGECRDRRRTHAALIERRRIEVDPKPPGPNHPLNEHPGRLGAGVVDNHRSHVGQFDHPRGTGPYGNHLVGPVDGHRVKGPDSMGDGHHRWRQPEQQDRRELATGSGPFDEHTHRVLDAVRNEQRLDHVVGHVERLGVRQPHETIVLPCQPTRTGRDFNQHVHRPSIGQTLAMKRIGLLGGMSWESSILYEELINTEVRERLGGVHSADLILRSYDFAVIEQLQAEARWDEAGEVLAADATLLQTAGAEVIGLCTNTMHLVSDAIVDAIDVEFVHLADATAAAIAAAGLTTVGLLGTRFTMEQPFYRGRLESHGLDVLVPDEPDLTRVHDVIYEELVRGELNRSSREDYLDIVDRLTQRGAEGVIAGCTEIELLVTEDDVFVPWFPTTQIHARAIVEAAFN